MARFAIVQGGTAVVNVIEATSAPAVPGFTVIGPLNATQTQNAEPGGTVSGTVFTKRVIGAVEQTQRQAPETLRQNYQLLRAWATQAHSASAAYTGQTEAQQDATVATTLDRLGTFLDLFAEYLAWRERMNE